ncbi:MAG TPA: crosslink repair DNA glycosylase YcaQ family protein [Ignavibacteriales bacterium]|nr:crosslink repair DNA glycosylase YcaQ family protein [Ignavibacteriales bacterium]
MDLTISNPFFASAYLEKLGARANILFHPTFIIEGQIAGTWGRILKKDKAEISLGPFVKLSKTQNTALHKAAERYGKFLNLPIDLRIYE